MLFQRLVPQHLQYTSQKQNLLVLKRLLCASARCRLSDEEQEGGKKPKASRSRGTWSDAEVASLLGYWNRGWRRKTIAQYLKRDTSSVTAKLKRLTGRPDDERSEDLVNRFLPVEQVGNIFERRALVILQALQEDGGTPAWRARLRERSVESWYQQIAPNVPAEVRSMLASPCSPNLQTLRTLPDTDTNQRGVYAWLLEPRGSLAPTINRRVFLYVGSASKLGYGLQGRKKQHLSKSPYVHNCRLWDLSVRHQLDRNKKFIRLMSVPDEEDLLEAVLNTRYLLVLAEAMFTIWLQAMQNSKESSFLHKYSPWYGHDVDWEGACSHNPLDLDIPIHSQLSS